MTSWHILLVALSTAAAFTTTPSTPGHYDRPRTESLFMASSTSEDTKTTSDSVPKQLFEGYGKPIVLIGSSSDDGDELFRLASSLSSSLVNGNEKVIDRTKQQLERSHAAVLLNGDDDDTSTQHMQGIALSPMVSDPDDGLFVVDSSIVGELIRQNTLSLTSGVIVIDFNHPLIKDEHNSSDRAELRAALADLAKQLYREGLLSIYVNVQSDTMTDEAMRAKRTLESSVYIPSSDYELCIRNEGVQTSSPNDDDNDNSSTWQDIEWELQRLVARALLPSPIVGGTGPNSADLLMGPNTFFLSLSFPNIQMAKPYVEEMCVDVDSMEYRVDLLDCATQYRNTKSTSLEEQDDTNSTSNQMNKDPRFDILYQQQRLRHMCRPHAKRAPALPFATASIIDDALPIVYTVRTANQAGTWPDDADSIKQMFNLLELGLRSGVEILDVESAWDASLTDRLLTLAEKRYTSLILGSHHVVGSEVTPDEAVNLFRQCRINNRAHGAKVVLSIEDDSNNKDQMAYDASIKASKLDTPEIPQIGLVLGEHGSYSRVINPRFTPVTHECLPAKAAPGQLTAAEIMAARLLLGQIPTEKYAILGHNIAYSVSPQMQGGAFAAVKLPHLYTRADLETVQEFVDGPIWNDDNFGGCSVTIPHKQNIVAHVDILTDAAKKIGSVNTVVVKKDKFGTRVLIGENTDWKGIYNPLKRRLGDITINSTALILGGGGTARAAAFAATKLGLEKIYYNRTPSKAQELANEFGGDVAKSLSSDQDETESLGSLLSKNSGMVAVVISTLPAAAEFQLPEWLLQSDMLPVVFDVNYATTATWMNRAAEEGCDVVRGSEMLWEQGVGQFELWTGRSAPYGVMKRIVLDNC